MEVLLGCAERLLGDELLGDAGAAGAGLDEGRLGDVSRPTALELSV